MALDTSEIVVPIVHLNGTSAESLIEERCQAYGAINAAMEDLRRMGPNGRDYYLVDGLLRRAEDQHRRRMLALTDIMAELQYEIARIET